MTGSLHEKYNKYWYAIHLGNRQYEWKNTGLPIKGNKRKAEKMMQARIAELEKQTGLINHDILFSDFLLDWLDVIQTQVRQTTYIQYEYIVKNKLCPYFQPQQLMLNDLLPIHIQRFYNAKRRDGLSPNTIKRYHANIRNALQYALRQNWIPNNPADRVELPKVEAYTGNFYTPSEIQHLLELVKGTPIETPVLFAATYGLRLSEIIGLKWNAIDFANRRITVQHTVVGVGKKQIAEDMTKTKKSRRSFPLLPQIEHYLQRQAKRGEYICTWPDGRILSPGYVSRKFRTILSESDLPAYRFHDLRHSAASLLIADGYSLKQVGDFLGHSSPQTTNRYAHLYFQNTIEMSHTMADKLLASAEKY